MNAPRLQVCVHAFTRASWLVTWIRLAPPGLSCPAVSHARCPGFHWFGLSFGRLVYTPAGFWFTPRWIAPRPSGHALHGSCFADRIHTRVTGYRAPRVGRAIFHAVCARAAQHAIALSWFPASGWLPLPFWFAFMDHAASYTSLRAPLLAAQLRFGTHMPDCPFIPYATFTHTLPFTRVCYRALPRIGSATAAAPLLRSAHELDRVYPFAHGLHILFLVCCRVVHRQR